MLHIRGDRYERHTARRVGDEDYYYIVADKEDYDEYEEDEFV